MRQSSGSRSSATSRHVIGAATSAAGGYRQKAPQCIDLPVSFRYCWPATAFLAAGIGTAGAELDTDPFASSPWLSWWSGPGAQSLGRLFTQSAIRIHGVTHGYIGLHEFRGVLHDPALELRVRASRNEAIGSGLPSRAGSHGTAWPLPGARDLGLSSCRLQSLCEPVGSSPH